MIRPLIILLCLFLFTPGISAKTDSTRVYTKENPLVFEDSWNLWPYSYLTADGKPEGYCIDLIRIIMRELNIPYVIKLKPHQQALKDLKAGKADLTLGLSDVYGVSFGKNGRICVALLTQSVVTPKSKPLTVRSFRDLKDHQIITKDSGLCHQLMVDYGWSDHAIGSNDIGKDILKMGETEEGYIVWNTLSLKWLIEHHQLDNLSLTPVNMSYGERKFMSNDEHLIELMERTYANLCAADKLTPLEEKWFYPERHQANQDTWHWIVAGGALLLLVLAILLFAREILQSRHSTAAYNQRAHQLVQLAECNKVRFWAYYVTENKFEWLDENGMAINSYTAEEFAKRYSKKDFLQLREALSRISQQQKDAKGHVVTEETLELRAQDAEFGDREQRGFVVHLSVLSHDVDGHPQVIIGTKKDVTKEYQLKLINTERSLRYLSMFYNTESGILFFGKDGTLQNGNSKAAELLQFNMDQTVKHQQKLNDLLGTTLTHLDEADGQGGQLLVGTRTVNYRMKTVHNDDNQFIGIFVFCI